MEKNTTVDFLRGISALWVVLAHCCIWGGYKGSLVLDPKVAVDIFMMVSGYLMMHTVNLIYSKEPIESPTNWMRFYVRRFFRISPGYYASLIVAVMLGDWYISSYHTLGIINHNSYLTSLPADLHFQNLFLHFTYLFGIMPKRASSTLLPDWSLGLEVQFYLIFPFIFLVFKRGLTNFKMWAICTVIVVLSAISRLTVMRSFTEMSFLPYQLPFFMNGILIYYAFNAPDKSARTNALILVFLYCIYGVLAKNHRDNGLLVIPVVMLAFSCSKHWFGNRLNKLFDNKITSKMADLSFSMYLFHGFVLSILGSTIELHFYPMGLSPGKCVAIMVVSVVPISYLVAYLSYRFIELPGMKMGKLVLKKFIVRSSN